MASRMHEVVALLAGSPRNADLAARFLACPRVLVECLDQALSDEVREFATDLLAERLLSPPFPETAFEFPAAVDFSRPSVAEPDPSGEGRVCVLVRKAGENFIMTVAVYGGGSLAVISELGHREDVLYWSTAALMACAWMLSRDAEAVEVDPPERLNRARMKRGRPPLLRHTVLRLRKAPRRESLGGGHASPRPHLRRGHVRTLKSGRKVPVAPCVVGGQGAGHLPASYVLRP